MNKTNKTICNFLFLLSIFCLFSISNTQAQADKKVNKEIELHQVKAKYVCMITDKVFEEKQIAVSVNGKIYYGCCQMCVKKLNNKPKTRFAVDPVSGEKINKAKAVIGATPSGKIYYFESVENMKKFEPKVEDKDNSN